MTTYFPPPLHVPEGTNHPWAFLRIRRPLFRGEPWVSRRRGVPCGYLRLLCRTGLHFMTEQWQMDAYACACGREMLREEDIRR